jgi:hypothetical protein
MAGVERSHNVLTLIRSASAKPEFRRSSTPIDDDHIALTRWLYRNATEEDAPAAGLNAFDLKMTDEDRDFLEAPDSATDSDVCIDASRKVEEHMPSDRPGLIVRKPLIELLASHGESKIHR